MELETDLALQLPDFGFGTGDFDVEGWIYIRDDVGTETLFDFRAGSNTDSGLHVYFVDKVQSFLGTTEILAPAITLANTTFYLQVLQDRVAQLNYHH